MPLIKADGLSYEDHCQMASYKRYYFTPDLIIPPEITYQWYQYNKYTMVAVRDSFSQKMVAYINALPIKNELYEQYMSGVFGNTEINPEFLKMNPHIVRKYDEPGPYILYLCSVAIHPAYSSSGTKALRIMLNELARIFLKLAENGIYISEILADPVSPMGIDLCHIVDMSLHKAGNSTFYKTTKAINLFRLSAKPLRTEIATMYDNFFKPPST